MCYGIIDVDGVVANFVEAALTVHNRLGYVPRRYDWWTDWGITDKEFWEPIIKLGDTFYMEMVKPYPWYEQVLTLIAARGPWVFVTTEKASYEGKYKWLKKWIPSHFKAKCWIGDGSKAVFAAPGRYLIDDLPFNTGPFELAGGSSFLFPQPWNNYDGDEQVQKLAAFLDNHRAGVMIS